MKLIIEIEFEPEVKNEEITFSIIRKMIMSHTAAKSVIRLENEREYA